MVWKLFSLLVMGALCFSGCSKSGDGSRVSRLLKEQEEHARQIAQMSKQIDTVDERLAQIQESLETFLGGGGTAVSTRKGPELIVAPNFASTAEYNNIVQLMGNLQERIASVQGDFVRFQEVQKAAAELEALRDREGAFGALNQPGEMSRRLDVLVKNFSGSIPDGATKGQFMQDVENLKASLFTAVSPEERLQRARALIAENMASVSDERMRGMMERQLQSLDEAQGDQLNERVDRILQFQRMSEVGELAQKYNIPQETLRDSGIVSFGGRGGPGGGVPGFMGGAAGPGGGRARGGGGR
jgi:hypothetical protein